MRPRNQWRVPTIQKTLNNSATYDHKVVVVNSLGFMEVVSRSNLIKRAKTRLKNKLAKVARRFNR